MFKTKEDPLLHNCLLRLGLEYFICSASLMVTSMSWPPESIRWKHSTEKPDWHTSYDKTWSWIAEREFALWCSFTLVAKWRKKENGERDFAGWGKRKKGKTGETEERKKKKREKELKREDGRRKRKIEGREKVCVCEFQKASNRSCSPDSKIITLLITGNCSTLLYCCHKVEWV